MSSIRINLFGGMAPSTNDRLIANSAASYAKNTQLRDGSLEPFREPLPVEAVGLTLAAPANEEMGEDLMGTAEEPVEVTPGGGVTGDFAAGATAVGILLLVVSAVVCAACRAETPDVSAALSV